MSAPCFAAKVCTVGVMGTTDEVDVQIGYVTGERSWAGLELIGSDVKEIDAYGAALVGKWYMVDANVPMILPFDVGQIRVRAKIYMGLRIGVLSTEVPGSSRDEDALGSFLAGAEWGDTGLKAMTEYRYTVNCDIWSMAADSEQNIFVVGFRYYFPVK